MGPRSGASPSRAPPDAIQKRLASAAARQNKDFALGGTIWKELEQKGIEVAHGPTGHLAAPPRDADS